MNVYCVKQIKFYNKNKIIILKLKKLNIINKKIKIILNHNKFNKIIIFRIINNIKIYKVLKDL